MTIDFFIEGTPAPGGSKSSYALRNAQGDLVTRKVFSRRRGRMIDMPAIAVTDDGGTRNKQWRRRCDAAAREAMGAKPPLEGPLRVLFAFTVQRPANHHIAGDRARPIKPACADAWPTPKPDASKLTRSTEDALTKIVWRDDAQIVQQYAEKRYANPGEKAGCRIKVTAIVPVHAPPSLFP